MLQQGKRDCSGPRRENDCSALRWADRWNGVNGPVITERDFESHHAGFAHSTRVSQSRLGAYLGVPRFVCFLSATTKTSHSYMPFNDLDQTASAEVQELL
jgi:hypothetical protein